MVNEGTCEVLEYGKIIRGECSNSNLKEVVKLVDTTIVDKNGGFVEDVMNRMNDVSGMCYEYLSSVWRVRSRG